ncbi:bacteriocin-like protein [Chryseobacterium sp. T16E-39]|nr:protein with bacteriocin-type signal sequence [Chryseobacterium sp. T16E-39]
MKNLKRLNRQEQKEINGGALKRCTSHGQCFGAWCCNGICVPQACIED